MAKPDFTRPFTVDRFGYEYGFNVHYLPGGEGDYPEVPTSGNGFCRLESQPLKDGRFLVIAYELPDNPGRSVTNAAEDIATQFAEAAGVGLDRLVWVESYALARMPGEAPSWDRCTFTPGPAGKFIERATSWKRMTPADWQTLGLERPAVPELASRKPG